MLNLSAHSHNHRLAVLCKFLGDFWTFWERDIFFSKNRLNWEKYEILKIWWIWKIEIIWSEEFSSGRILTKQSPTDLGLLFGVVNCLVVFPAILFNPNNSLLIILSSNFTPIYVDFWTTQLLLSKIVERFHAVGLGAILAPTPMLPTTINTPGGHITINFH